MAQKTTGLGDRWGALRDLLKISDDEFQAYMDTYGELFVDSPENTLADHKNGVAMRGYKQGSSPELEQYCFSTICRFIRTRERRNTTSQRSTGCHDRQVLPGGLTHPMFAAVGANAGPRLPMGSRSDPNAVRAARSGESHR